MKKFIYRMNTVFTGELVEETERNYFVEFVIDEETGATDIVTLEKEITVIEEIEEEEKEVEIIWSKPTNKVKGKVVETKKHTYIIQKNGNNGNIVHRMFTDNKRWNRRWVIEKGKGKAGLPKIVTNKL